MSHPIAFIDTETTSLGPLRRAWEVALLFPDAPGGQRERTWLIDSAELDLGNADPMSLRIGGFYERHPFGKDQVTLTATGATRYGMPESAVLREVERLTRGVQLHGSRPEFDVATLEPRMRANGLLPAWYHHCVDVPSMCLGYLTALGRPLPEKCSSENLSRAVGVDPDEFERHTALGDCRWQYAVFQAMRDQL